ncbi:hypothetical protein [Bacteroides thetaiotaomicron]|uniref:hypothetical protein n=1 Tax=Bacteroides thetaiotaomicron TaxID=818 RepID=UPI00286D902F|nr:hypothetical protein [Bacteroides thetaiotaomicron]MCS2261351.1 hypothetical protein [Bacteroides thetaiotaomicron]
MIADEGNDQASNQAELLLRAAVRLIAPRSAAASGRRLTGLHPPCARPAPSVFPPEPSCHRQRLSENLMFCSPCRLAG